MAARPLDPRGGATAVPSALDERRDEVSRAVAESLFRIALTEDVLADLARRRQHEAPAG